MKLNNALFFAAAITLPLLASCSMEPDLEPESGISFAARTGGLSPATRASCDTVCASEVSGRSFLLTVEAEPTCGTAVKGAPVLTVHDRIGVSGYRYPSWQAGPVTEILDDVCFTMHDGIWTAPGRPVPKLEGTGMYHRYFAYGPYGAEGLSPDNSSGILRLKYEVPSAAEFQQDIIVASTGDCDPLQSRINLDFRHILSSVRLSVDDASSNLTIKDVCFRNISSSAEWDYESGWKPAASVGDFHLPLDLAVHKGTAVGINGGENTLMLLPQTLGKDACVAVTLVKDGNEQVLSAPIAGQTWEPGVSYSYVLHLDLDDISTIEFGIDMRHRAFAGKVGANFHLPKFIFQKGTRRLEVDWGDGSSEVYTTMPSNNELAHQYASGFVGKLKVKVRGTCPKIEIGGTYVQFISTIDIKDNTLYDSRNGCNCIVETATGRIIYAGIAYSFPSGATALGPYSMVTTETRTVTIPSSVTSIEEHAFGTSYYLNSISIPSSVKSIADAAFLNSGASVSVAADNPYYDTRRGLKCVMETATDYIVYTFRQSSIPEEAKGVRPWAMSSSPLDVVLPAGCLDVMESAFRNNSSIVNLTLPASCSVGDYAFYDCMDLKTITTPGGVKLGKYTFSSCRSLIAVDLEKFTSVGSGCFSYCKVIEELNIPEGYVIPGECFKECSSLLRLTVPSGCKLGDYCFEDCDGLKSVDLYCSTTSSSTNYSHRFYNCSNLSTLRIYDGFTNCTTYDFYGTALSSIECRCHEKPAFYLVTLPQGGVLHTIAGTNFLGWMKTSGLEALGWSWQDDLTE